MKRNEVEERLKTAVERSVPDVRETILSQCDEFDEREGMVIEMEEMREKGGKPKSSKAMWRSFAAAAAVMLFVVGGMLGYQQLQVNAVDSVIELDVNPSIELQVSKAERIVEAKALNQDAETILDGMDLKGTDLDVALNALIGSMLKHGYISDLQNSILISVENRDTAKGKALEERLVDEVNSLLNASSIEGAILSQQISVDEQVAQLAEKYDISTGKASLIREITKQNSLLSEEELKDLNINELNLLASSKKVGSTSVNSTGKASDKAYIGEEKAKKIALKDAGVSESKIRNLQIEMDIEKGIMVYEVEFAVEATEYDYEIDAKSGAIVKAKTEIDDDWAAGGSDSDLEGGNNAGSDTQAKISESKAKSIALKHADVSSSKATFTKVKLDYDDGGLKYDIEFYVERTEYEYEIDAMTGKVLKADKDEDDDYPVSSTSNGNSDNTPKDKIGRDNAKSIALKHAGVSEKDVSGLKIKLEKDGNRWNYEVKFCSGSTEYDYTLNAISGEVLKAEKDVDDAGYDDDTDDDDDADHDDKDDHDDDDDDDDDDDADDDADEDIDD